MSNGSHRREISWFWIIVFFCIPPMIPVAFILLFIKLFGGSSRNRQARGYRSPGQSNTYQPPQAAQERWDWRQQAQNVEAKPAQGPTRAQSAPNQTVPPPPRRQQRPARSYQPGEGAQAPPQSPPPKQTRAAQTRPEYSYTYNYSYNPAGIKSARLQRKIAANTGRGLMITGGILIGTGALVAFILAMVGFADWDWGFAIAGFTISMVSGGIPGLFFLIPGKNQRERALRCQTFYAMMQGKKIADIRDMAAAVPCSYSQACKDLRWMIHEGFFPGAYIDASKGMLMHAGAEPEPKKPETQEAPPPKQPGVFPEVERIRQLNEEIADGFVSERMDRLEELTFKIFSYVEANPGKEDRIRQFRQHYLPKTIKILESYARFERQGVVGANIRAAMKDVEEIMDTLVSGFEKQLDMLFVDEALDVTTDINVLESMMGMQGLSSDDPFKLELMGGELT